MAAELGHHRRRENKLGTGWPGVEQEGARGTPAQCLGSRSASGLEAQSWPWDPAPGCPGPGNGGQAARSRAAGVRDLEKLIY